MPGMQVGAPAVGGNLGASFVQTSPMGSPFASMTSGPTVNPSSPYPPNSSPSLYSRGNQPGMFWAQETIPQLYLHKLRLGSSDAKDASFENLVKNFWEDVTGNVRGETNSNTPSWPLFALNIHRESTVLETADITNKDILKFRGVTGQFATWTAIDKYLLDTDFETRKRHGVQTETDIESNIGDAETLYAALMSDSIVLRINFVGVLKNIPTGGVGSTSVSMNVISGGRVTMINHWGTNCMEGTRLYFLVVYGLSEDPKKPRESKCVKLIPYANCLSNEKPSPGIPLDLEVRYDIPPENQHKVLRVISVGRCLHATVNLKNYNPVHEIQRDARNKKFMRYTTQVRQNAQHNLKSLGKVEVYIGI